MSHKSKNTWEIHGEEERPSTKLARLSEPLRDLTEEWDVRNAAITDIVKLIKEGLDLTDSVVTAFLSVVPRLLVQLKDGRSAVAAHTARALPIVCRFLSPSPRFAPTLPKVYEGLCEALRVTIAIVANSANDAIVRIINDQPMPALVSLTTTIVGSMRSAHPAMRMRASNYVSIITKRVSAEPLEGQSATDLAFLLADGIQQAITDPTKAETREQGRQCFLEFEKVDAERATAIFNALPKEYQTAITRLKQKDQQKPAAQSSIRSRIRPVVKKTDSADDDVLITVASSSSSSLLFFPSEHSDSTPAVLPPRPVLSSQKKKMAATAPAPAASTTPVAKKPVAASSFSSASKPSSAVKSVPTPTRSTPTSASKLTPTRKPVAKSSLVKTRLTPSSAASATPTSKPMFGAVPKRPVAKRATAITPLKSRLSAEEQRNPCSPISSNTTTTATKTASVKKSVASSVAASPVASTVTSTSSVAKVKPATTTTAFRASARLRERSLQRRAALAAGEK